MNNARVINAIELRQALQNQFADVFIGPVIFMNENYCAPTRSWVEKQFTGYLWEFQQARGQNAYSKRGNQCEHFALRAALEVVDLFRQMPDNAVPADAESIAIAACKFQTRAGLPDAAWHEVNLWYLETTWCEWEPQSRKFFTFTKPERSTLQQIIVL